MYADAASGNLELSSNVHMRSIRDADCVQDACKLYDCNVYNGEQPTAVTVNCGMYTQINNCISIIYTIRAVDCTDGAMRLVGGSTVSEGRLEICHNGQWGTICNQGWTDRRAAQVRSRLGLPTYSELLAHILSKKCYNT